MLLACCSIDHVLLLSSPCQTQALSATWRCVLAQLNAIDPGNLTAVITAVAPDEPHHLTTDTGALIFLFNQSLTGTVAAALLANKVLQRRPHS